MLGTEFQIRSLFVYLMERYLFTYWRNKGERDRGI